MLPTLNLHPIRKLRDAIKSTPAILVINKMDLLPRKINRYDLNFIKNRVQSGRTRVISAYAVSAATGEGLVELAEGLLLELAGKDVFVVGAANVGKSTLVKMSEQGRYGLGGGISTVMINERVYCKT